MPATACIPAASIQSHCDGGTAKWKLAAASDTFHPLFLLRCATVIQARSQTDATWLLSVFKTAWERERERKKEEGSKRKKKWSCAFYFFFRFFHSHECPFPIVFKKLIKNSDRCYTEMLFRALFTIIIISVRECRKNNYLFYNDVLKKISRFPLNYFFFNIFF